MLSHKFKESFNSTAYAINVYVQPGKNALRLTRLSYEDIQRGNGIRISLAFATKPGRKGAKTVSNPPNIQSAPSRSKVKEPPRKRKRSIVESVEQSYDADDHSDLNMDSSMQDVTPGGMPQRLDRRSTQKVRNEYGEGEDELLDWTFTMRAASGRTDRSHKNSSSGLLKKKQASHININEDVIELSSGSE